jgi:hypothetical protein
VVDADGGMVMDGAAIGDAVAGGAANGDAATGGAVTGGIVMTTGATSTNGIGIAGRGPAVQDNPAAKTTTKRALTTTERMFPRSLRASRQARATAARLDS